MHICKQQYLKLYLKLLTSFMIGVASLLIGTITIDAAQTTAAHKTPTVKKHVLDDLALTVHQQNTTPQLAVTNVSRNKPAKKVAAKKKAPKKVAPKKKATVKKNAPKKAAPKKKTPTKKKNTKSIRKQVKPKTTKKKKAAPVRKNKLAPLYNAPFIKNGKPHGRPQLTGAKRLAFEKKVYNWQIKNSPDGKLRDPYPPREILHWKPGQSRKNKVDFGHKKHHEYKKWFDMYKYRKITLQQFKAHEFDPNNFYIQAIGKNRSRIYEAK